MGPAKAATGARVLYTRPEARIPYRELRQNGAGLETIGEPPASGSPQTVPDRIGSGEIEPVEIHDLCPGRSEIPGELLLPVGAGVDLGQRPELGV